MKGHIVIPSFYRTRWTDDYKYLLDMVSRHFNFRLEYNDNPEVDKDTDVVILFAVPHHMRPHVLEQMVDLPKNIKVIGYMKDIHHRRMKEAMEAYNRMFERYDLILSSADQLFRELYPKFGAKAVYFPDFFGPHERYASLPFNDNPIMQCLVSGASDKEFYPFRDHVIKEGSTKHIIHVESAVTGHGIIKDDYAKMLNQYFCCMTCGSVYNYTLAKYFEIPASGSLLIANETEDLKRLGFIPDQHYVKFDGTGDVIKVIQDCLNDYEYYENHRKQGREFVLKNHSIFNRFDEMVKVINVCFDKR